MMKIIKYYFWASVRGLFGEKLLMYTKKYHLLLHFCPRLYITKKIFFGRKNERIGENEISSDPEENELIIQRDK